MCLIFLRLWIGNIKGKDILNDDYKKEDKERKSYMLHIAK